MLYCDVYPTDTRDPYQAAVDRVFPVPDSPHASVVQRAIDNRAAMWRGIEHARLLLRPVYQARSPEGDPWRDVTPVDYVKARANGYETRVLYAAPEGGKS